jgi:hypothetical protein
MTLSGRLIVDEEKRRNEGERERDKKGELKRKIQKER